MKANKMEPLKKQINGLLVASIFYTIMLLVAGVTFGQSTFDCNSDLYQVVNGKDLKKLDPATGVYTTIGSSSINYNGAGYNYEDGYIYGIGTGNILVRIDNTGEATNLGSISGFSAISYSGDLDTLGNWFSFRKNGSDWIMNEIDVSSLPPVANEYGVIELAGVTSAVKTNDMAYNSLTNKFYGMHAGILVEFDPFTRTVKGIADYSATVDGGGYGAAWSDEQGNTYFFNNGTGNIYRAQFDASGNILSFAFQAVSAPNGSNDGMGCPLAAPPVFPEICNNGIDDDLDGLTDCDDPDCYTRELCGVTAEFVNSDYACSESIATFHSFFTNNSNLTNTLTINTTLPSGFIFLHDTLEFDLGGYSDFSNQPVEGNTGFIEWGSITLEAGETVRISYDVTFDEATMSNGVNTTSYGASLSTVGSQLFPSSSIDVSTTLGTCPEDVVYSCEPAFYQVYQKKGKNQPNMYGKLDPITGDYDPIAVASDYANGLGFDINTGLVYGANGKRFIRLDADGMVIDQGITFSKKVYRGDINNNSEWYGVVGSDMVKIDVSGTPLIVGTYVGQGLPGWDIAYNENGNFYSLHSNGALYEFNTTTNLATNLGVITGNNLPSSGGYGAQWTGSDGYLYASHNLSGVILRVDVATRKARVVSSSIDGLKKNDGFSCPTEIPAVYEFDYGDNSALPQYRILSYKQDLSSDNLPDYNMVWLGNTINYDSSDPSNANADGDLDDGFAMTTEIANGTLNTLLNLNTNIDTTAFYSIAIDWDDNGTLDSLLIKSISVSAPTSVNETIIVPPGFTDGYINVRVIASEAELTEANVVGDNLNMGEVEDYRFFITTLCEGCEVETGFNGGLESNGGIAAAIAKRNYMRKISNESRHLKASQVPLTSFLQSRSTSGSDLSSYLPATGFTGNEEVNVSTPEDLVELTNAVDVFAQDFYLESARVAGTLILKTESEVYDHAKIICDRLNGKTIEKVQLIEVNGFKMLYASITSGEMIEHSAWFSAKSTEDHFEIQSKWNIDGYESGDYLNFQVWSSSSKQVFYILEHILNRLQLSKELIQEESGYEIPGIIVQRGAYESGTLILDILNLSGVHEAVINASVRTTETTDFEEVSYSVSLSGDKFEEKVIETGYLFDVGLSIYATGNDTYDDMYLADGSWGTDFNTSKSNVHVFRILAETNEHTEDVRRVERGFEMEGESSDVINVFRNLKGGNLGLDVSAYSSINFDMRSNTPIEVVLVEKDLTAWDDRRRVTVPAQSTSSRVRLSLDEFRRNGDLGEIQTLVFSYLNQSSRSEEVTLNVSNIYLGNEQIVTAIDDEISENVIVYPNPADDFLNITFPGKRGIEYEIQLIDLSGTILLETKGEMIDSQYSGRVYPSNLKSGIYLLKVVVGTSETMKKVIIK